MIQTKLKNYWMLIALVIIANVLVFKFFSHRLESFVTAYTTTVQDSNGL